MREAAAREGVAAGELLGNCELLAFSGTTKTPPEAMNWGVVNVNSRDPLAQFLQQTKREVPAPACLSFCPRPWDV